MTTVKSWQTYSSTTNIRNLLKKKVRLLNKTNLIRPRYIFRLYIICIIYCFSVNHYCLDFILAPSKHLTDLNRHIWGFNWKLSLQLSLNVATTCRLNKGLKLCHI